MKGTYAKGELIEDYFAAFQINGSYELDLKGFANGIEKLNVAWNHQVVKDFFEKLDKAVNSKVGFNTGHTARKISAKAID